MKVIRSDDFRIWLKGYTTGREIAGKILTGKLKAMNKHKIESLKYLETRLDDFEFEIGEKE